MPRNLGPARLSGPAVEARPPSIPRALRWLLLALALQLVADVATLAGGERQTLATTVLEVGALLVDGVVLALLTRATELTRTLLRTAAGLGMAIDAWILLGVLTWAPREAASLTVLATSVGLVAASGFAWVVLGREDVKAWVFARWLRRHRLDGPDPVPS
jgi:hypothetical protein